MIAIVTDSNVLECGKVIHKSLVEAGANAVFLPLGDEEIKACLGCGGCETKKSFRRCVFRDGADKILPYIAQSDTLIIITPLVYGGYSYQTKLVVDKLALLGDIHYYIRDKEISKGKNSSDGKYFVVGISDDCSEKEAAAFQFLVRETLLITNWRGKAILSKRTCDTKSIAKEILEV
jgi:multimeric flavodoxin WrbA